MKQFLQNIALIPITIAVTLVWMVLVAIDRFRK